MASETWRLDGITLDTLDVSDAFTMAIAQYKIPYRRGALLENMGLDDRTIRIKCAFMEERYADHKSFVEKITATSEDSHELNHPAWGLLIGSVNSCVVTYDDKIDYAEIDISFVVEADDTPETLSFLPTSVASEVEEQYAEAVAAQMDQVAADMENEIGAEASEIVDQEIDPETTLLDQFLSASQQARDYIAEVDAAIAICEAHLDEVEIASSAYINTIEYGTGLPGRLVEAMTRVCERICQSGSTTADSPRSWLANLESAFAGFRALFSNGKFACADQILLSTSARYAIETAYQYKADNDNALLLKTVETGPQFDIMGQRTSDVAAPVVMTIDELDETLYVARDLLQQCVDVDRRYAWTYKRIADSLFKCVQETRLQRNRMVTVSIETIMPLHLVLVKNGIPIGMADRILSINPSIRDPNTVSGDVKLYAA